MTLPNSGYYLQKVLQEPLSRRNTQVIPLWHLPQDYQLGAENSKPGMAFASQYFALSRMESKIMSLEETAGLSDNDKCIVIAKHIEGYLDTVGNAYDQNPEQKSMMLLTVMELWTAMDEAAVNIFGLLKDFHPGLPVDVLDVLQLPRLKDMYRVQKVRQHIQVRVAACKGFSVTIFHEPTKGCFADRYYDGSQDSFMMQELHQDIEAAASIAREYKEEEWGKKSIEFEELVTSATNASCVYTTDQYQVRLRFFFTTEQNTRIGTQNSRGHFL